MNTPTFTADPTDTPVCRWCLEPLTTIPDCTHCNLED